MGTSRQAFFSQLGAGPAVVNFVANALIGLGVYAFSRSFVTLDMFVAVLLAASLSVLAARPKFVRAAAAGHVAGLPMTSGWRVLPERPVALTLLASLVIALCFFGLAQALPADLSVTPLALIRGAACAIGAHLAIVICGMRALVGAPDRTAEYRAAIVDVPAGQPLEPLDKGVLACADERQGVSAAPVWHLVVTGELSDDLLRRSVDVLAERCPSLRMRVVPVDGLREFARDFRYIHVDTGPASAEILYFDEGPLDVVRQRVNDHFIDLFEAPPIRITCVRDTHLHLLLQQHHGIADGRAMISLLSEWAAIIRALDEGTPLPTGTLVRRPEVEAFGLSPRELARLRRRGIWRFIREAWGDWMSPLERLPWNRSKDYRGANRCVRLLVPQAELDALRPLREGAKVSLNSLLTATYIRAVRRWSIAKRAPVERIACDVIAETRPRDGSFLSFANHLSSYHTTVAGPALEALIPAAQAVQAEIAAEAEVKAHFQRVLVRSLGIKLLPLDALREIVFKGDVHAQISISNLLALPMPELAGRGWRVRDLWITTPAAPPHGITLTVTAYGGLASFNFNYTASAIQEADAIALANEYATELCTLQPIAYELLLDSDITARSRAA